jgi:hypothetical protein
MQEKRSQSGILLYCPLNESFWVKESLNKYIKYYWVMAALSARALRSPVFLGSDLHAKLGAARLLPAHSNYTLILPAILMIQVYFDFSRLRGYLKQSPLARMGLLFKIWTNGKRSLEIIIE